MNDYLGHNCKTNRSLFSNLVFHFIFYQTNDMIALVDIPFRNNEQQKLLRQFKIINSVKKQILNIHAKER